MKRIRSRDPLGAQQWKTQRADSPEDLWQPLYDRANVATTVPTQVSFFSVPKGQSASLVVGEAAAASTTKDARHTNLETANVVPTKMHVIVGISFAYLHQTKDDINNLTDRDLIRDGGYLEFKIVDKTILQLPLFCFPDLNPISGVATTVTNVSGVASQGGGGYGNRGMYPLPIKVTLNPYENFNVTANFGGTITLNNTLDLSCILQGFMRRPT